MCSIDATKVESLIKELESQCSEKYILEIYNFNTTQPAGNERKSVDVRVAVMEDGNLKIIRVKKNERRAAAIDVMCLHRCVAVHLYEVTRCIIPVVSWYTLFPRQHDFRLELELHEAVNEYDPEFVAVKKMVETMCVPKPGTLSFCPCTDEWKVNLLRYKRQSTFVLEDTFLVTLSDVKECKVNWEHYGRDNLDEPLEVNLEDFDDRHWELEV